MREERDIEGDRERKEIFRETERGRGILRETERGKEILRE